MPKTTFSPNAITYGNGRMEAVGGSLPGVLTDASDSTYARKSWDDRPLAGFNFLVEGLPAGNDVYTIVPKVRLLDNANAGGYAEAGVGQWGSSYVPPFYLGQSYPLGATYGSIYTHEVPASQGSQTEPHGAGWKPAITQDLGYPYILFLFDSHSSADANRVRFYELAANVFHSPRPSIASITTNPATPDTTTNFPSLSAAARTLVDDWETPSSRAVDVEIKVFTDAQYGAGGFDPATSTPFLAKTISGSFAYIDGTTSSDVTASWNNTPGDGTNFPNDTYRVYARAKRGFVSAEWGGWSYAALVVNVPPPTSPTITVTGDDAGQKVTIVATPVASTGATSPYLTVERKAGSGDWTSVRGATRVAAAFGVASTFLDYEAPRGVSVQYRATVEAIVSTLPRTSDWATSDSVTVAVTGWNLKCPTDPAHNLIRAAVLKDPDYTQEEDVNVMRPKGRSHPVVVSMSLGGADGSLAIETRTDTEWAALAALRDLAVPLYLESPFGWARYIRIIRRSWKELGSTGNARRRVELGFVEVEAP